MKKDRLIDIEANAHTPAMFYRPFPWNNSYKKILLKTRLLRRICWRENSVITNNINLTDNQINQF